MLFTLTQAAAERIELSLSDLIPLKDAPRFFEEWAVDAFQAEDAAYFLLTERVSLFSMLFPSDEDDSTSTFEQNFDMFIQTMFQAFIRNYKAGELRLGKHLYFKAEDGRLRAAQAEHIERVRSYILEGKPPLQINRIPLQELGLRTPEQALLEEMGRHLDGLGYIWLSNSIRN